MLHSGRAEAKLESGPGTACNAAKLNPISQKIKRGFLCSSGHLNIYQMQEEGRGAKGIDSNLCCHVFWQQGYGRPLTCMFVCQGDECAGDVPAPVKTHHFGLHIPIGCLQTRDNWRYHGNKWCCARHTRALACTYVDTQIRRWKEQKWGYFLIAEDTAQDSDRPPKLRSTVRSGSR